MKAALSRVWTLVLLLLREQGRERVETVVTLVVLLLATGAMGYLPPDFFSPDTDEGPSWSCVARPPDPPAVAAVGDLPAWLRWPEPLVAPDQADVLLRFEADKVEVVEQHEGVKLGAVTTCLWARMRTEKARRLSALGVLADGEAMVAVSATGPLPPEQRWELNRPRFTVATIVVMVALSVTAVAARARMSGFRESLAASPARPVEWVGALLLFALVGALVSGGLGVAGVHGGAALAGREVLLGEPWTALVASVFAAALSLRVGHDSSDYTSAMARTVIVTFALMALGGASALLDQLAEPWGALVPAGAPLRALTGAPLDPLAVAGGALVTLAASALLFAGTVRAAAEDDPTLAPSARTALRRARGEWGPEVLLLSAIGLAGGFLVSPVLKTEHARLAFLFSQVGFLAAPALLAPALLGLPTRPLLGLTRTSARSWLSVPLLVCATAGFGTLAWQATSALLEPPAALLARFSEHLTELLSGPGLLLGTVGAGLVEELFFRGLLLGLLLQRSKPANAVLIQAAAFALFHAYGFKLAPTFAIGLVLGVLRLRTGSILPGMVVHAAHNAIFLVFAERLGVDEWSGGSLLALCAVGLLGLALARR